MRTEKEIKERYQFLLTEIEECEKCEVEGSEEDKKRNPKTYESIRSNKRKLEKQKYVFEWILGMEDEF